LDKIYGKLNHKSSIEFGISENISNKKLEDKLRNTNKNNNRNKINSFYIQGKILYLVIN
jgi:hypothetical protein